MIGKHATTVSTGTDGKTRVTYHSTDVVTFDNESIVLDTGGWATVTTKRRMNEAADALGLGFGVYQKDYDWFVDHKGETHKMTGDTLTLQR